MPRYQHSGAAVTTRLQTAMTPGGPASVNVESSTNWPSYDFWIVIDRGTVNEEKILVGSRTSNTLSSLQRGGDGGSAVSHPVGAVVEHVFTGLEADQANAHINTGLGVHGLGSTDSVVGQAQFTAHTAATQGVHGAVAPASVMVVTPGMMVDWAGGAPPDGWLVCDGSAVSRTTYAALFAQLGTTWGAGDGSTTFNLPGRSSDWFARYGTPGDSGGADTDSITLDEANMPAHTHTSAEHAHTGPSHTHAFSASTSSDSHTHTAAVRLGDNLQPDTGPFSNNNSNRLAAAGGSSGTVDESSAYIGSDSHTHTVSGTASASGTGSTGSTTPDPVGSTGSGAAFSVDTVPVYSGLQKIIYAGV